MMIKTKWEETMTKKEYDAKYPQGEHEPIKWYRKALHKIMTTEEIDNLILVCKGSERRWLKKFKKEYLGGAKHWADLPVWVTLPAIQSRALLLDVIVFMFGADKLEDEWDEGEGSDGETSEHTEEDW